jgi:hypothetical protein
MDIIKHYERDTSFAHRVFWRTLLDEARAEIESESKQETQSVPTLAQPQILEPVAMLAPDIETLSEDELERLTRPQVIADHKETT